MFAERDIDVAVAAIGWGDAARSTGFYPLVATEIVGRQVDAVITDLSFVRLNDLVTTAFG